MILGRAGLRLLRGRVISSRALHDFKRLAQHEMRVPALVEYFVDGFNGGTLVRTVKRVSVIG